MVKGQGQGYFRPRVSTDDADGSDEEGEEVAVEGGGDRVLSFRASDRPWRFGTYWLRASSRAGSARSEPVRVRLTTQAPTARVVTPSLSSSVGDTVELVGGVTGVPMPRSFQWYFRPSVSTDDADHTDSAVSYPHLTLPRILRV